MAELKTTIGLEIHVQLKTASKMFCRCDNHAEGKEPNTLVCPVCLGLPGALPVANKQAVEWTIKTGLVLGAKIPRVAKFDRKHYFYPDLPKGYQISQYDEPFVVGGEISINGEKVRFNRVHLEEDAGKLIHSDGKSLVDLNRAGTPLMEMVTEPDITSPKLAGDFLRRLQKLVRDEVKVSEADMEKGHLRCDANISVTDGKRMSEIVEIKNLNSFRFVEKALALEDQRLKEEYPNWPEKKKKVTRGYDSKKNITYVQRVKEEAADYRYFPEPDLPPFDASIFDLEAMKLEIGESLESKIEGLMSKMVSEAEARVIVSSADKSELFYGVGQFIPESQMVLLAKAVVHNYFPFSKSDQKKFEEYAQGIDALAKNEISKNQFSEIVRLIHEGSQKTFREAMEAAVGGQRVGEDDLEQIIDAVIEANSDEVNRYQEGKVQLIGFFVGQVMKKAGGRVDPKRVNELLRDRLNKRDKANLS